ncbi:MAG: TraR/DksA family transcriptional regulator [Acidobacteria bacterium]|nr:TraR/DksA family transcriptional regulator [Acidobacteriota bacterium]
MNRNELNRSRQTLEAKQAELSSVLRRRDDIAIEKSADAIDEVQRAAERELAIRNLDRESRLLRNVRAAIRRIDEGNYGVCAHCDEPISPKRLAAVPWASMCIRCQEAFDRHQATDEEVFEDLLVTAA